MLLASLYVCLQVTANGAATSATAANVCSSRTSFHSSRQQALQATQKLWGLAFCFVVRHRQQATLVGLPGHLHQSSHNLAGFPDPVGSVMR